MGLKTALNLGALGAVSAGVFYAHHQAISSAHELILQDATLEHDHKVLQWEKRGGQVTPERSRDRFDKALKALRRTTGRTYRSVSWTTS